MIVLLLRWCGLWGCPSRASGAGWQVQSRHQPRTIVRKL